MIRKTAASIPIGFFELSAADTRVGDPPGTGSRVRTASANGKTYNVTYTRFTPQQVFEILTAGGPDESPKASASKSRRASVKLTAQDARDRDNLRLAAVTELLEREGSVFMDGSRVVDFEAIIREASNKYALSANPEDYLYTIDIAVAADLPNLNEDEFPSSELTRFDTYIGQPVYASYRGVPRHLNHKTDDPLEARGVVLEAHYHDDVGVLATCPQCHSDTSKPENRTADGRRCAEVTCGHLVRPEYVEILSALDKTKDPDFIRLKKAGKYRGTSMGCECRQTECFVCGNMATKEADFCVHIAENKGRLFVADVLHNGPAATLLKAAHSANPEWKVIARDEAHKLWRSAGWTLPDRPSFGAFETAPGVWRIVRRAKELCHGVQFKEQSDVLQPAEPSALTQAVIDPADFASGTQRFAEVNETLRALGARLTEIEETMNKAANKSVKDYIVVRVNKSAEDTYAAETIEEALKLAAPEATSHLDWCRVAAMSQVEARKAFDPSKARALTRSAQAVGADAGVQLEVPENAKVIIQDPDGNPIDEGVMPPAAPAGQAPAPAAPNAPGGAPAAPGAPGGGQAPAAPEPMTPEQLGVIPPPAEVSATAGAADALTADDINSILDEELGSEGDTPEGFEAENWRKAEYFERLNVQVSQNRSAMMVIELDDVPLFSLTESQVRGLPGKTLEQKTAAVADAVAANGLFAAAVHLKATPLDALHKLASLAEKSEGTDPKAKVPEAKPMHTPVNATSPALEKNEQGELSEESEGTLDASIVYSELDAPADGTLGKTKGTPGDLSSKVKTTTMKSAEDARIARLEDSYRKLSAQRVQAARAETVERFGRALNIALRRELLDLESEPSALKMAFYTQLTEPQVVGHDSSGEVTSVPMPGDLAKFHIQAAFAKAAESFTSGLLGRAARFASYNEDYIKAAEDDVKRIAFVIPTVMTLDDEDSVERTAEFRNELGQDDSAFALEPGE